MRIADAAFYAGRVAATTKDRAKYWDHWGRYCSHVGVDPTLQTASYLERVRALSSFAGRVRSGALGRGRKVQANTVVSAISAVGQTIALDYGVNPTKQDGSEKFLLRLQIIVDGMRKEDPMTTKKLPVESDVPEYLARIGGGNGATEVEKAVGDQSLIAFYYLLRVGEYTIKGSRNETKQTVQFKMEDLTFFKKDMMGLLRKLPRNSSDDEIMTADSATLKLDNQKNGWKGVCVHQEANGELIFCPFRTLGRRYIHIRNNVASQKCQLSAYFVGNTRYDVTAENMSRALKCAAEALEYPAMKGIPVERIDTHSLRSGGANALALAGYSDTQIQKMGRWRGATFKEYIREELASFSAGMSTSMKQKFNFVNVAAGAYHNVTDVTAAIVASHYNAAAA